MQSASWTEDQGLPEPYPAFAVGLAVKSVRARDGPEPVGVNVSAEACSRARGGSVDRGFESVHVTYQLAGRHHAAQLHDSWAHQVKVFGSTARKLIVGQHLKDEGNDSIVKPLSPGALGNGQCEEGRIMNEQRRLTNACTKYTQQNLVVI